MTARQERLLDARDALLIEARKTIRALILVNDQCSDPVYRKSRVRSTAGNAVPARRSGDQLAAILTELERMSLQLGDVRPSREREGVDRVIDLRDRARSSS